MYTGPQCKLQNRVHFHVSHKLNAEKRLMYHHQHLQDVVEDQLTLASIHYLRGHYQEAIDIYKRLVAEHPHYLALNVYLALCYYKLDYYDVSQEVLALYLARVPDSVTAGNLKACNHFRLYNGKAAQLELAAVLDRMTGTTSMGLRGDNSSSSSSGGGGGGGIGGGSSSSNHVSPSSSPGKSVWRTTTTATTTTTGSGPSSHPHHHPHQPSPHMFASDILRHNQVVFGNGQGALAILEPLVDIVPEARLNLALWHLRHDDMVAAYELMRDVDPASPSEYILKAIVYAVLGQAQDSRDHIKQAQQYFQLVGGSASECDTIAGRQCMASCFFLVRHFDDVLIYLNSIKAYFFNDDTFNYNYGITKTALGAWTEAIDAFQSVVDDKLRMEFTYISHLAKSYIMTNKARQAWDLYLKMDTSSESFTLLQLIANESYRTQQYLYAAKAYDVLERLDPDAVEHWEGKRAGCLGVFQQVVQGREPRDALTDVLTLLRNSSNPQVEYLVRMVRRWAGSTGRCPGGSGGPGSGSGSGSAIAIGGRI